MNTIKIDLQKLQDDNGHYSETDVKELERLTGKSWQQLHAEAEKENPTIPEGTPKDWSRATKLKYIKENGHEGYKKLLNERR